MKAIEQLSNARDAGLRVHVCDAPVEIEIVVRAEALVQAGVLEQHAGARSNGRRLALRIESKHLRAAGRRLDEPEEDADHRRLAGAIRAKEAEDAAARSMKRHII